MERGERFHRMHRLFKARKCIPLKDLMEDFGMSRAQVRRDIEYLQDFYQAPLIWDRERRGYRYDFDIEGADRFELPGVWFNSSEIYALLVMDSMLQDIGAGLLSDLVGPLIKRLESILGESGHKATELRRRIRVHNPSARPSQPLHFATAAQGVLERRRVTLTHYNRASDKLSKREVSPQRLINYRGNWYLDGWCHLRKGIRSFALDAMRHLVLLDVKAIEIEDKKLDAYLASSYGIFAGEATETAVLKFDATQARWVQFETWHPKQFGRLDEKGAYTLEIPYSNPTELIMDILRYGQHVEVISPPGLRLQIQVELEKAIGRYRA